MKIGAVYPQIELEGAPEALETVGKAVEAAGLDHLVLYDHVVGAVHQGRDPVLSGPYTERDPFHDPMVAFGYLAGITERIKFYTGVLILPQRQTVLVAKQATDIDLLSGGRLVLGVGIGWNYVEYDALGQDFRSRGKRMDEQIPYLRRLWNESEIVFDGAFDRMDRGNLAPRPRHGIPIFAGGISEAAYLRAAKFCDGFLFAGRCTVDLLPDWARVRELVAEQGRAVNEFVGHAFIMTETFSGPSAQDAADDIRRWQDAGGTEASIVTMGRGYRTPEEHIDHYLDVQAKVR